MFNRLHGVIRVKKEDQQPTIQQPTNQQPTIQQNVLPIIISSELKPYTADNYKFEPPKPIEYIPPEIIPKENPQQQYEKQQYEKPQYEKPQYEKPQYEKPQYEKKQYNNKEQGKRFATFDAKKEAQKGNVFDELAKKSLEKYKINSNNIENDNKSKSKPRIEVIPKETIIKKQEFVSKKNSADNKKYLSEIEAIKKSLAR